MLNCLSLRATSLGSASLRSISLLAVLLGGWFLFVGGSSAPAAEASRASEAADSPAGKVAERVPNQVQDFLEFNCVSCHDGESAEAGLDLAAMLEASLAEPKVISDWVHVYDRVHAGEMPPEEAGEVPPEEVSSFLQSAGGWLREYQRQQHEQRGRVRARRLTNLQMEKTLHDLLAIEIPLQRLVPEEPRREMFVGVAREQSMSHFKLQSHLRMLDAALDEAFERAASSNEAWSKTFSARELARKNPKRRCRDPEMLDGKAVTWSSGLPFYGKISSSRVDESGWYRIKVKASAVKSPDDHGVWCTVRSGRCNSGAPLMSWIGSFEATEEPQEWTFDAWIPAGHMLEIRPGDTTLGKARFKGGQVGAGEGGPQDVPGVALHSMVMTETHSGGTLEDVRSRLFGELEIEVDHEAKQIELVSDNPADDLASQLRRFARQAFRRPVPDSAIQPYLAMLREELDSGESPVDSLRTAYRALLCSPRFLYFTEPPGELDDHAIACRLSYFLWNTMPDEELRRCAEQGQLRDPEVLHEQVERMLEAPRGKQFVKDFAAQWLDLMEIDASKPHRRLYRDFDNVVQQSMLDETHAFLQDLLDRNASASKLIDADFTFLNERLARYYGIEGVPGDELRKVDLPEDSRRGGLLAQGAILKVTANGTNTSPVLRGVWVSERLLGQEIPPPPASVPAIEPDIRGAKTIREQLAKHKSDPSCASCHVKIDPPGFALENFDAAGKWREKYVGLSGGKRHVGGKIDPSSTLPDGRDFKDFEEFRKLVQSDPRPIARNLAEKLLTYGTGATVTFADREVIEEIVDQAADDDYGLRSLLHAVVASPAFLSK